MRHELEPVHRPDSTEHPAPQQDQPAVLEHPDLAAELVLDVPSRLLPRDCLRLDDGPAAALNQPVGEREVVPEARVQLEVVLAADGIDGANAGSDRPETATRSSAANPRSAHIDPRGSSRPRPGRSEYRKRTPRRRLRSCERACASRLGATTCSRPKRRGPRRRSRARPGPAQRPCRCVRPRSRRTVGWCAATACTSLRPVVRSVGDDDELELVPRVVLREEVREPLLDHRLLVVCRHDDRDG